MKSYRRHRVSTGGVMLPAAVAGGAGASVDWAPPPWLMPVAKLTSSWHEPRAARDGASSVVTSAPLPWWHLVQLAISAGKPAFHHSNFVLLKPRSRSAASAVR